MKKIIVLAAALTLTACSAIPISVERSSVNTEYDFGQQMKAINKRIAIVEPNAVFEELSIAQQSQVQTMMTMMASFNSTRSTSNNVQVESAIQSAKDEVKRAVRNGIQTIITKRGFTYSGPYESFDEITYRDKKSSYLAIIPEFNLQVRKLNTSQDHSSSYNEEKGELSIDGEFTIKLIEPMTKQVIMQKRVDLTKLDIREAYIIQEENNTGNSGLIRSAIKQSTKPDVLVNNYPKAYAQAMTRFYQGAMKKIDSYISREEMLHYESDVNELKGKKVY